MRAALSVMIVLCALGCDPGVSLGARCEYNTQCPSGLVCGFGRCRVECFENRDCALGALCLVGELGSTCALADDPGCAAGEGCPAPLACFGTQCMNACESIAECPSDARCEPAADGRARCVRVDVADAGTSDGGGADAGVDGGGPCVGPACDPIVEIVAAEVTACARTAMGRIWCWGHVPSAGDGVAAHEACGGSPGCAPTPVQVRLETAPGESVAIEGALQIALGPAEVGCALLSDRRIACWGPSSPGALGTGLDDGNIARWVRLEADPSYVEGATEVRVGETFALAGLDGGTIVAWGHGELGQLGDIGGASHPLAVPTPVALGAITAGLAHACTLHTGEVVCWGSNRYGQVGVASPLGEGAVVAPIRVSLPGPATQVQAARNATCALVEGDVYCWGVRPSLGVRDFPRTCGVAIPDGELPCSPAPLLTYRPAGVEYLSLWSGGGDQVCALDERGVAFCWLTDAPQTVVGLPAASAVAAGWGFACALSEGEVWCWGANDFGQLGRGGIATGDQPLARVQWPTGP